MPGPKENEPENNFTDVAQFVADQAKPVEPAEGTQGAGGLGHEIDSQQTQSNG